MCFCGLDGIEATDYFQTRHSKNGKSSAQKQIVVVVLNRVSVVLYKGWVGIAHRILLKGVFLRFAESYMRRCFGNGQKSCGVGLDDLWRSLPTQTFLILSCEFASRYWSSSRWAVCVQREEESYFTSSLSDVLHRKLGNVMIIFARVVGFY